MGRDYIVAHGKDEKLVKNLLAAVGDNGQPAVDALKAAARSMLTDDWGSQRASIGFLSSGINQWLGGTKGKGRRGRFTPAGGDTSIYSGLSERFDDGNDKSSTSD